MDLTIKKDTGAAGKFVTEPRVLQTPASTGNVSDGAASTGSIRHCSFCLKKCTTTYIVCALCQKRTYCSHLCQMADWPRFGNGQGHKDWCENECGQEDMDWQVVPVPGKGLGIVAKRNIPAGYRIIVERGHTAPRAHPAIQDLMPENGTLMEKFNLNALRQSSDTSPWTVSLRISRLNHDCDPNAAVATCTTTKVNIVYAQRDIPVGQEICIPYQLDRLFIRSARATSLDPFTFEQMIRFYFFETWNICCPADCLCRSESLKKLISKAADLFRSMEAMIGMKHFTPFTQPDEELIKIIDSIHNLGPYSSLRLDAYNCSFDFVLFQAQQLAMQNETNNLEEAWFAVLASKLQDYSGSAFKIQYSISPFCKRTEHLRMIVSHESIHLLQDMFEPNC